MKHCIPSPVFVLVSFVLICVSQSGCTGDKPESPASAVAVEAAPQVAQIPPNISIPVEIDGNPSETITTARLETLPADMDRNGVKAWFLTRFLGDGAKRGRAIIEIEGSDGVAVRFPRAISRKDNKEPALAVSDGAVVVALLAPVPPSSAGASTAPPVEPAGLKTPENLDIRVREVRAVRLLIEQRRGRQMADGASPAVGGAGRGGGPEVGGNARPSAGRGKGGAMQRGQGQMSIDSSPLGMTVAKAEMPPDPNIPKENPPIKVMVDGSREDLWTFENLSDITMLDFGVDERSAARKGWSLRELLVARFGPEARITHMIGDKDRRYDMDAALWDNTEVLPTLRLNRRKSWKLQWVRAADLGPFKAKELRGVKEIHVVTSADANKPKGADNKNATKKGK